MRQPGSRAAALPCLLLLLLSSSAFAFQQTIRVPADQPTIQAGIDAAVNGDSVLVAPGTYQENIDFKGKAIIVQSSAGAQTTILDGGGTAPAVTFSHGETRTSIFSGFTVQNGGFEDPFGSPGGRPGGISLTNASASILNNIITGNHCFGIVSSSSSPLVQNNNIRNTLDARGTCAFAGGSAIFLNGSLSANSSNLVIPPLINGNVIENNTASGKEDAGGNGGAGIAAWTGNAIIENNLIRNNVTIDGNGAAINLQSSGGTVIQNVIYGNRAGGGGGAIAVATASIGPIAVYLANNTIADNTFTAQCGMSNCAPVSQIYFADYGPVGSSIITVNNIISGNSAEPSIQCGEVPPFDTSQNLLIFDHNLFYNSGGPVFGKFCQDETGRYGNQVVNPQFRNAAAFDYHLGPNSPAIDAGNTSALGFLTADNVPLPVDFDNNPRLQDLSSKGYPTIDIGAYEVAGTQGTAATTALLLPSAYHVNAGAAVTFSARTFSPNGVPTGPIDVYEDGTSIGTVTLDPAGLALLNSPALTPGIHDFTAVYAGQGAFTPATSVKVLVVVDKYVPTLSLTSSPNPSLSGQSVTFTATISSPDHAILSPITLAENGVTLATLTPDTNGVATFSTSSLNVGIHNITATYAGDAAHQAASATVTQTVTNGYATTTGITSQPNPSAAGQSVTFVVTVTNTSGNGQAPTGSVTLSEGTTVLGTVPLASGANSSVSAATFAASFPAGSHTINASFVPAGAFAASSGSVLQVVNGQTSATTLSASPNPAAALSPVTLSASVTASGSVPAGTVTFYDGAAILGAVPLDAVGNAVFTAHFASAGVHSLTATYSGGGALAASTSTPVAETIRINSTSTSLTVTPTPSAVAFSTITLTSVTRSPSSAPVSTPVCSPACAPPSISFIANGNAIGSAPVDQTGTATITVALPAGTYSFSSAFLATPSFSSSTSASISELVTQVAPVLTLTAQPNPAIQRQTVALTASFGASLLPATAYTGSITFLEGATVLGVAPIGGSATSPSAIFSTSTLSPGTHAITAVYSGSANLTGASARTSVSILAQDFTITTQSPLTIKTEHHAPTTVTITTTGALADTIHLSCGTLPEFASCIFSTTELTTNSDATVTRTSTLTIDTDAVIGYALNHPAPPSSLGRNIAFALLLPVTLLGGLASRRRHLPRLLLALIAIGAFAVTLTGCSGKYPGHTAPGTYSIPVTGQARGSGITHTTTLTVVVTP